MIDYRKATIGLVLITVVLSSILVYDRFFAPARTTTVQTGSANSGCSYVLYQNSGSYSADSCIPGKPGYSETTATALLTDMQTALGSLGGRIEVQKGTWVLTSQWPTVDLSSLVVLEGEGPTTLFEPGGASNFDPINPTLVNVFNINMVDKYGIQVSFTCDPACNGQLHQSFPLDTDVAAHIGTTTVTFLGNYIRLDSQALAYPALVTGYAVAFSNGTVTGSPSSNEHALGFRGIVRTVQLRPFFPLFMEPIKGDYNNFIGFRWTSPTNLRLETHLAGVSTMLNVAKTMDTNDHIYELDYQCCAPSATSVVFKYDGTVIGTITTNIIPYPGPNLQTTAYGPVLEACEPDAQIMALYLKTPFLTPVTR